MTRGRKLRLLPSTHELDREGHGLVFGEPQEALSLFDQGYFRHRRKRLKRGELEGCSFLLALDVPETGDKTVDEERGKPGQMSVDSPGL